MFLFFLDLFSNDPFLFHSIDFLYLSRIYLVWRKFNIKESLIYSQEPILWEGLVINNTLPRFNIYNLPLQIFKLPVRKEIFLIGKIKKCFIISIPRIIIIKNKIIGVLFFFNLLSLINLRYLSNYIYLFPCGPYIVDRITCYDSLDLDFLYNILAIDKGSIFYIIIIFIILLSLMLVNIIIISFIMIFLNKYKLYKIWLFLSLPLNKIKPIINRCHIFGFISINIIKFLNCNSSAEVFLFNLIYSYNNLFESLQPTKLLSSYLGKETPNNLITNIDNSQIGSSQSTVNSVSNINEVSNDLELDNIESGTSDTSENERSNNIEKNLINKMANIKFSNFNLELNLEAKYEYLKFKFYSKGIDHNIPYLEWFINLLTKTDGNKTNIDKIIETNLNHILKIERESKLNNLASFRTKPFLINKIDNSPLAFPNLIPIFKGLAIYGEEDNIEDKK